MIMLVTIAALGLLLLAEALVLELVEHRARRRPSEPWVS